jgi:hypothetical protein
MRRSDRVRAFFPLPYVSIVVLLIVLILVTPNLVSTQAGSLCSEAQLLVDWTGGPSANFTHFYLRGICSVRYASIMLGVGTNASSPGAFSPPASATSFRFDNVTWANGTIQAMATTALDPVALNVSAVYVDASMASVTFVGTFAFDENGGRLFYVSYPISGGGVASAPVSSLPLTFTLTEAP